MRMKKRYWIAGAATLAIAGKLLTRPRDADWDKCRDVVFHSEHSCFIDVDGIRVHYQEAGDRHAPAMVLIHGFASSTLFRSEVSRRRFSFGTLVLHRCRRHSRSLPGSRRQTCTRDGVDSRICVVDARLEQRVFETR